jgi:hypothetical protein
VFHANVKYEFWYFSNFSYTPVPNFTTKNNAIPVTIDVCLMMRNATVNDISYMSWRSVLLVEEIGGPGENHRPVASH